MLEDLLMVILECGSLDLKILADCQYDAEEIVEDLKANGIHISLNNITNGIFEKGQNDLRKAVDEKKEEVEEEIESLLDEKDNEEDRKEKNRIKAELKKLEAVLLQLESLDPVDDMQWYCNCLDTSCWLHKYETYKEHLSDEISRIEDEMGFDFGIGS